MTSKRCATCRQELSIDNFHGNKQQKDGLSCYCKQCTREKTVKKYHASASNHLWKLESTLKASKTRAKRKNLEHTLTLDEMISLYPPDNMCPIFGVELAWGFPKDTSPSLDRIDSSKGYTFENCQIICNKANRIKADASIEELELLVEYLKEC